MKTRITIFIISILIALNFCNADDYWEFIHGTDGSISSMIKGNGDTIYASYDDFVDYFIKSTNNGLSWEKILFGNRKYHFLSLAINRKDGFLFAGTEDSGVVRSTDNGNNWHSIGADSLLGVCVPSIYADDLGNVYVVECFAHIWHSRDNGDSWERLFDTTCNYLTYNSFYVNKKGYLFAKLGYYYHISKDNGKTWNCINNFPDSTNPKFFLCKDDVLYAGFNNLYKSTNDGDSWDKMEIDFSPGTIGMISINEDNRLLLGGFQNYKPYQNSKPLLYIGKDKNYLQFDDISSGLPDSIKHFNNILLTNDNHYLLLVYPNGIYRSTFSVGVDENEVKPIENNIFPNPATDFISLPGNIAENTEIEIYSGIGVKLYTGLAEKRINISNFAPGLYYVKAGTVVYKFVKMIYHI